MLLPFAYEIERGQLSVAKTSVVVTADGKDRCPVLGLMLLTGRSSGRAEEKAAGGAEMELQAPREPVYERIQIRLDDSRGMQVTGYNMMQPPGKMAAAREARRAEGGKKSSSRDRRSMERTVAASGYAVFVVEVPASVQRVEAVYRSQTTIRLETPLLEVLGQPAEKIAGWGSGQVPRRFG